MKKDYNVKFGDIWKMGEHRLLCGDSTEKVMLKEFLKEKNIKVCITDPPYGISYTSRCENEDLYKLKLKNDHTISWGDAFRNCQAPVLYVWFSYRYFDITSRSLMDAGYDIKQMIVWAKNHFSLQRHMYHLQHEQSLVCIKDGSKVTDHWKGDRRQVSLWNIPSVNHKHRLHPTEKPVGVYTIPIKNHTLKGELVLDIFAGSGTLFEAAERLGRVGLGVELCPNTCSLILSRMKDMGCKINLESNLFTPQTHQPNS
ncbi:MAG: site-specific DNA-methyltransferase [Oligoflexales bacterium]